MKKALAILLMAGVAMAGLAGSADAGGNWSVSATWVSGYPVARPAPCAPVVVAPAPVVYPGSIERTSVAEKDEQKGTLILLVSPSEKGGTVISSEFMELPTRPMIAHDVPVDGLDRLGLENAVGRIVDAVPQDAVLRLRLLAPQSADYTPPLTAARLRELAPGTMNVEFRVATRQPESERRI